MCNEPKIEVGVKIIVYDPERRKMLTIQRTERGNLDFQENYDIPGGRIEQGEEPLAALRRELYEEAGLTLPHEPFLLDAANILNDTSRQVIRLTYGAVFEVKDEDLSIGGEHSGACFMPLTEGAENHPMLNSAIQKFKSCAEEIWS